jgi:5-methyltetrahydrofolate--homocysteine methyltransferase
MNAHLKRSDYVKNDLKNIIKAVSDGDDEEIVILVKEAIDNKIPAIDILNNGLVTGVQALGSLFKDGKAYLPEILISVRAMNRGLEVLQPYLSAKDLIYKGTVVLGTVEGDIHDIGKNLVGMMLKSNGFNVIDLGVDVPTDSFVEAAKDNRANIVAMSALLTTTIIYIPPVIEALKKAGLKNKVKVLVGGAGVTQEYANEIGAEGFAADCVTAVDEANRLMKM